MKDWIRTLDTAAEVGLLRNVGTGLYTVHPALLNAPALRMHASPPGTYVECRPRPAPKS